jgi:hypothetical protein
MSQFTILKPGTPQQSVVVCTKCNRACELQRNSKGKALAMTVLMGPLGLVGSSLAVWWKCYSCGKKYHQDDFRKGRIQTQRYEGETLPTYRPD